MAEFRTLLRREESYAIHALVGIAETPVATARLLAGRFDFPRAFLAKVLRKLVEAGFIESRTGRNGGVRLTTNLDEISVLDVVEAISGTVVLDSGVIRGQGGRRHLTQVWLCADQAIQDVLATVILSQLSGQLAGVARRQP